jgi:hypothetical protein
MFPSSELCFCLVQLWFNYSTLIQHMHLVVWVASFLFQSCPSARWSARAIHHVCLHFGKGLLVGLSRGCRMNACPSQLAVVLSGPCHGLKRAWEDLPNYIYEGLAREDPPQPWTWKHRARVSKNNQCSINQTMGKKEDRPDKPESPDWARNSEPHRPWAQKRMLNSKWKNKQLD